MIIDTPRPPHRAPRFWGLVALGILLFLAIASPEMGRIWKARVDPARAKSEQRTDTLRTGLYLVAQEQVRGRLIAPRFPAQRDVSVSANGRAWVVAFDVESQAADGSPTFSGQPSPSM